MIRDGQKYIGLTIVIREEDEQYAAYCKQLGTATCGQTFEEATRNIKDAVLLDVNTLEELGERARFFRERGITVKTYHSPKTQPRKVNLGRIERNAWASHQPFPLPPVSSRR